jgi:putative two-component system response regulator
MGKTGEKKNILLVDDDEIQREIIKDRLDEEYEVYSANSGNDAFVYLHDNYLVPDLILLDILMPGMDGWEVFDRIKTISDLQNVPIAFLTTVTEPTVERRAFSIGANDFITKSNDKERLMERVRKIFLLRESELSR